MLKENGGQASAFNAGFCVSRGNVILFLDSGDVLCSTAIERSLPFFRESDVIKVHWQLRMIDSEGHRRPLPRLRHRTGHGVVRHLKRIQSS